MTKREGTTRQGANKGLMRDDAYADYEVHISTMQRDGLEVLGAN